MDCWTGMDRWRLERSLPKAGVYGLGCKKHILKGRAGFQQMFTARFCLRSSLNQLDYRKREREREKQKLPLCLVHWDSKCPEITAQEVLFSFLMKRFRRVDVVAKLIFQSRRCWSFYPTHLVLVFHLFLHAWGNVQPELNTDNVRNKV